MKSSSTGAPVCIQAQAIRVAKSSRPAASALQGLRADLARRLADTPETGASCPLRPAA